MKKHFDTVIVLGAILTGFLWVNGKFNNLENRLTKIEIVLIMQKIMPTEMIANTDPKK